MDKNSSIIGDVNRARNLHEELKKVPDPVLPEKDMKRLGKSGLAGLIVYLMTRKPDKVIAEYEGKPVIRRSGAWEKYLKPLALGAGTAYLTNKILKHAQDNSANGDTTSDAEVLDRVSDYAGYGKWGSRVGSLLALRTGYKGVKDWHGARGNIAEFNDAVKAYEKGVPAYDAEVNRLEEIAKAKQQKAINSSAKVGKFKDPKHVERVLKNMATRNFEAMDAAREAQTAKVTAPSRPQPWDLASRNSNITVTPARRGPGGITPAKPKVKFSTKARGIGGLVTAPLMWWMSRKFRDAQHALHNDAEKARQM